MAPSGSPTPLHRLPAIRSDGSITVVVETHRGATIKVKHDPDADAMMLSRPLPAGVAYPFDWGFIPSTRGPDGDPLDAMILWDCASYPGLIVPCRLLGMLEVEQRDPASGRRQRNDRLFTVPVKSPRLDHLQSISDVPERVRMELEEFFRNVVAFEGKALTLGGFAGPPAADAVLRAALV